MIARSHKEDNYLVSANSLPKMLMKYFSKFDGSLETLQKERARLFLIDGKNGEKQASTFRNDVGSGFFSGVKVYPPLGFIPWPQEGTPAYDKTNFLYQFCEERSIPITTHCSDGGFVVNVEELKADPAHSKDYMAPLTWKKILEKYPALKLNFGHFGVEMKAYEKGWGTWICDILDIIADERFKHVYADVSYVGVSDDNYKSMIEAIREHIDKKYKSDADKKAFLERLSKKVMFGTDFMVNLFDISSNLDYINIFSHSNAFEGILDKDLMCRENPEGFLFGK